MHYREASETDVDAIVTLYRRVASQGGGIARKAEEVDAKYVSDFVGKSIERGLIIVAEHPSEAEILVAGVHAYRSSLEVFSHVFGDLTLVVDPEFQGRKIGRTILTIFLNEIAQTRTDVGRVELMTRESNARAIALYQSLGFRIEGRLEMRIKSGGHYEADIPMGWQNPNYEF